MSGIEILKGRGVSRLCHFTKMQSLTHILASESGILASQSIRSDIKNVTDKERYDGELDYICCSVEYPNSWFLEKAIQSNTDQIFIDWVVLYIDVNVLDYREAKYCPCNASKNHGKYIDEKMENLDSIFAKQVPTFRYPRTDVMLKCCPTDGQAEILIKDNIPRNSIIGIAVGNADMARRVYAMLGVYEIEGVAIYIATDVLTTNWSSIVKQGRRPHEQCYSGIKED